MSANTEGFTANGQISGYNQLFDNKKAKLDFKHIKEPALFGGKNYLHRLTCTRMKGKENDAML